jgi:hypothetical protein
MLTLRNGLVYSFVAVADKTKPGIWLLDQASTIRVAEDNQGIRIQSEEWEVSGLPVQEVFLSSKRFSSAKGKVARKLAEAPPAALPTIELADWSQEVWDDRGDGLWKLSDGADGLEYCLVDPTRTRVDQLAILKDGRFALPETVRDWEHARINSGRPAIGRRVGRATSYPWRWSLGVDLPPVAGFVERDLTYEVWPRFDAAGELVLDQGELVHDSFVTEWAEAAAPDPFYGGWDRIGRVPTPRSG